MRNYLPFILTAIICIGITLLISNLIWGSRFRQSGNISDRGIENAAMKGKSTAAFIFTLTSDTARYFGSDQTGSGVIISEDGYIVTNHHVIARGISTHVMLDDRREYHAQLIGSDSSYDVALLKIQAKGLPYLEFGNSDSLLVGEPVLAVGSPYKLQSTVTAGIVSAKDRDIDLQNNKTQNFIQTDVPINMGNSGGALLDANGRLMGLNVAFMSTSGQYEGFSFAIPSNLVKKIVDDIRQFGSNQIGAIGMSIRPVMQEDALHSGLNEIYGVVVELLTPGGAADSSGLQPLDYILFVDGNKVNSSPDFMGALALHRPGDVLSMTILRNGALDTVDVKLRQVKK